MGDPGSPGSHGMREFGGIEGENRSSEYDGSGYSGDNDRDRDNDSNGDSDGDSN